MLLHRAESQADELDALVDRVGSRVGVGGVLADLTRSATVTRVPGRAPVWGFAWDEVDKRSRRWFPQGITTSADRAADDLVDGRSVVCTSWYSRDDARRNQCARVTFADVTDRGAVRYRHVLLVEASRRGDRGPGVVPVKVHAGGLVWHGPHLHVAGTGRGIAVFRLDDIVRVSAAGHALRHSLGYDYVLPLRFWYDASAYRGVEPLRYSFLSVDRSVAPHRLLAGEYARRRMTTRLVAYAIDPDSSLLSLGSDHDAHPVIAYDAGVRAMQGAVVVDGTYYVTTSAGRRGQGSLWVGRPGAFTRFPRVLPVGPEDIAYWPSTQQLWSLTEYPNRRYVFAMDRPGLG